MLQYDWKYDEIPATIRDQLHWLPIECVYVYVRKRSWKYATGFFWFTLFFRQKLDVGNRFLITGKPHTTYFWALLYFLNGGDVHGQYYDILRLLEYGGFPPESNYLFFGDYVDRGKQSLETICLLLAYKIKFRESIFLLRGNHECASIHRIYDFYDECKFLLRSTVITYIRYIFW